MLAAESQLKKIIWKLAIYLQNLCSAFFQIHVIQCKKKIFNGVNNGRIDVLCQPITRQMKVAVV